MSDSEEVVDKEEPFPIPLLLQTSSMIRFFTLTDTVAMLGRFSTKRRFRAERAREIAVNGRSIIVAFRTESTDRGRSSESIARELELRLLSFPWSTCLVRNPGTCNVTAILVVSERKWSPRRCDELLTASSSSGIQCGRFKFTLANESQSSTWIPMVLDAIFVWRVAMVI